MMTISKESIAKAKVLVVGDAMLDRYWYGAVERISPEAPVPVVRVTREENRIGAAANVAYNVVTMGGEASLLCVVGEDEASHQLEVLVATTGIKPYFERDVDLKTTVKLRVIGRQQQLLRVDFENTPKPEVLASQTSKFAKHLSTHDVVLFSDYAKGGLAQVVDMISLARQAGKTVLVDPKGADYARYAGATVITPNRSEMQAAVGSWKDNAELADKAQNLRAQLKLDAVLVTLSEQGMALFDAQGALHIPTHALEVFDVTGAGDTVIATLATLLAAGLTLRQAIPYANKAGGIAVGKFGTSTVSFKELFE
jgi:D-glycero-beta-D-manno-heptose-7-phosphate kinase